MNIFRTLPKLLKSSKAIQNVRLSCGNFYEPDYLELSRPKIPIYDTINIKLRGYDYPVLEEYQQLAHKIAKTLDIAVEDSWGLPSQNWKVLSYKPNSEIVNSEYKLYLYQRLLQVVDVPPSQLGIFLQALESCTPAGVTIDVSLHDEMDEEARYIPDKELLDAKVLLDDMGGPSKKK